MNYNHSKLNLTEEQLKFINEAKKGKNILVDACVGSGKTTSIQKFCNYINPKLNVLYLTYNKLLKIDAQKKIKKDNIYVTNYHGYAHSVLKKNSIKCSVNDLIYFFNKTENLFFEKYDILIIDEYQDITLEISQMLEKIKAKNPNMQIIAVGDYEQKIYEFSPIDIIEFIKGFLGNFIHLNFTVCFRLNDFFAKSLGNIWHKTIKGVNNYAKIDVISKPSVIKYLEKVPVRDILCLGAINDAGVMYDILNELETKFPEKFNKKTVYAAINDKNEESIIPKGNCAIFTSFDRCKGLEKNICFIFDFNYFYWNSRLNKPNKTYEILRNIFCVTASRGKNKIFFVYDKTTTNLLLSKDSEENYILDEQTLLDKKETEGFENVNISEMFDFKYKEDVNKCYQLLKIEKIETFASSKILVDSHDELIDLSFVIGIFIEAIFFKNFNMDIENKFLINLKETKNVKSVEHIKNLKELLEVNKTESIIKKVLFNAYLNTNQLRYYNQVDENFINDNEKNKIINRLATIFSPDELVQLDCEIPFYNESNKFIFKALGICDVIKNKTVYELKFVNNLSYNHFLQVACYIIGFNLKKGVLWNIKDNSYYEISIPNKKAFLDQVVKALTKGIIKEFYVNATNKNLLVDNIGNDYLFNQNDNLQINNINTINSKTNEIIDKEIKSVELEEADVINIKTNEEKSDLPKPISISENNKIIEDKKNNEFVEVKIDKTDYVKVSKFKRFLIRLIGRK